MAHLALQIFSGQVVRPHWIPGEDALDDVDYGEDRPDAVAAQARMSPQDPLPAPRALARGRGMGMSRV